MKFLAHAPTDEKRQFEKGLKMQVHLYNVYIIVNFHVLIYDHVHLQAHAPKKATLQYEGIQIYHTITLKR